MKLLSYDQMKISVVSCTAYPGSVAKLACDHTMLKTLDLSDLMEASKGMLKFLVTAEHTSVLEHCSITFAISGVSRSLLAQLTRQRMASVTSQSQHYQDYSEAPMVVDASLINSSKAETGSTMMHDGLVESLEAYRFMVSEIDVPREEARQVLPNAAAVNILWTANARSLMLFLRQRLCKRNVAEMSIFAERILDRCMTWWPELFELAGPPCRMDGACNQGSMKAKPCW